MNPRYPIYIISKGRWERPLTHQALLEMGVSHRVVIEPQEYKEYEAVIDPSLLLILPEEISGSGCSIPARNWVWEHSIEGGYDRHWILDDNIKAFYRLNKNLFWKMKIGTGFYSIEQFVDRYLNIALAGMHYFMFAKRKASFPPFLLNTRIYSNILIKNDLPFRWRGRYNEDTDLSLRVLKDRWVTVLFYIFLADKISTMKMKGGNTESLYQGDGRLKMAQSLQKQHPDVVKIVRKWGRWQHQVDYRSFKQNKLRRKPNIDLSKFPVIDEFDMEFKKIDERDN